MRGWSEDWIAAELADFLDELRATGWPTYRQFWHDGRGSLRKMLDEFGGAALWAEVVGLPLDHRTRRPGWDERRIEQELRAYLRGRSDPRWPLRADLKRDGRGLLLAAVDRERGLARWRNRFADDVLERRL